MSRRGVESPADSHTEKREEALPVEVHNADKE
jgi:hypothetical protein